MKMPLSEGDVLIRAMLREQWHLDVTDIHFIPMGDSAFSYRVEVPLSLLCQAVSE